MPGMLHTFGCEEDALVRPRNSSEHAISGLPE